MELRGQNVAADADDSTRADDAHDETTGGARSGFGPLSGGFQTFTEFQRQGIAAATEVAERFTAMLDGFSGGFEQWSTNGTARGEPGAAEPDVDAQDPDGDGADIGELRAAVARSVDLYTRMFQNTFEAYADMVEGRMRARGVRIGAGAGDGAVADGVAGEVATGSLWVHNDTGEAAGPLNLRMSAAESAAGGHIAADHMTLEPDQVEVAAGSSVAVQFTADLTDVAAGHYHALVLVQEEPADSLPLAIVVHEPDKTPRGQ